MLIWKKRNEGQEKGRRRCGEEKPIAPPPKFFYMVNI